MKISWHKWERIASRITGFSTPVGGVDWDPPVPQITAAERAITYLESKGLLYTEFQWENPNQCYADASALRDELTRQMLELPKESFVYRQLDAMRDACRVFRERLMKWKLYTVPYYADLNDKQRADFLQALGGLRDACGKQIMILQVEYNIDVADHLKACLPSSEADSD
jgi:hypothetical protein